MLINDNEFWLWAIIYYCGTQFWICLCWLFVYRRRFLQHVPFVQTANIRITIIITEHIIITSHRGGNYSTAEQPLSPSRISIHGSHLVYQISLRSCSLTLCLESCWFGLFFVWGVTVYWIKIRNFVTIIQHFCNV